MKHARVVITAFCISIGLSLIIGTLILFNTRAVEKSTRMSDNGKEILASFLALDAKEKAFLLYPQEDISEEVKKTIGRLRKLLAFYEKERLSEKSEDFREFDAWEETLNLYERLFDQFVLYRKAVEKSIADIRALEKSILAVIYSKMNPERGIIALQEVRIHEKGYLLYRNYPEPPDERSFEDMRKEAVNNLLIWAQEDKRIEELMDQDNKLFSAIIQNFEGQDDTLLALRRESRKMQGLGAKLFEEGNDRLQTAHRRLSFLSMTLLVMWAIVAFVIVVTRFR